MEIKTGKSVIDLEVDALKILKKNITSSFKKAINILFQVKGKIIDSGIGKSGQIGSKIASTF